MAMFLAYPLLGFFARSLSGPEGPFQHYAALLAGSHSRFVLWNTLKIAGLSAGLAVLLGYPVALLIASVRPVVARILLVIVLVPFWTSILVRSYAWVILLGRRGVVNSTLEAFGVIEHALPFLFNLTGVLIAMIHVLLPYTVLPLLSVMSRLDRRVIAAAESLGARPHRVFLDVLLPLTLPGVLGGFILAFTLALGFFVTPALLGGAREIMVAMLIQQQVTQSLAWGQASATGAALCALVLLAGVAGARALGVSRLLASDLER